MTEKRPPLGRRPLPDADRRSVTVQVRLTEAQKRAFDARGGAEWLRRMLTSQDEATDTPSRG